MHRIETALRLRIFLGEDDKYKGRPMYEEIIVRARQAGLAGATVFRGYMGYGAASGLNPAKLLRTSHDLPFVVEILDAEEKVDAFLLVLEAVLTFGIATVEKVQVRHFGQRVQTPS